MRNSECGIRNEIQKAKECGMRPEPCKVQGCPALHVVQGGLQNAPHPHRSAVFDPELRPKGAHDEALPREGEGKEVGTLKPSAPSAFRTARIGGNLIWISGG